MMHVYWMEAKCEFLKMLRMRVYSMTTVLFPLMFYCFFGLAMGQRPMAGAAMPMARYLLATYGAFGVIGATLFAFGVGIAVERGLGWLEVKRASPMPPAAYFVAKGIVSMTFGAMVVTLLFALGAAFGNVRMPAGQWLALGGTLIAGAIPFCALGLAIGGFAGPNSAPATVNMIYMPLAFLGGLWIPIDYLPAALKQIAPFLPTYHFSQLALGVLHARTSGTALGHIGALAAFTVIFAAIAWFGNTRESERMYG
jgi:ABC-2 type transport system permease protein